MPDLLQKLWESTVFRVTSMGLALLGSYLLGNYQIYRELPERVAALEEVAKTRIPIQEHLLEVVQDMRVDLEVTKTVTTDTNAKVDKMLDLLLRR